MITDFVITKLEELLDSRNFEAEIVPESNAYPTSGELFVSLVGANNDITMTEGSIQMAMYITTRCSIRTGKWSEQTKGTPYKALIDLQERVFFTILGSSSLLASTPEILIDGEPLKYSVSNIFKTNRMNTKPVPVQADFWFSKDQTRDGNPRRNIPNNDTRRERGYLLEQTYKTPILEIPFECATFLDPLASIEVQ